MRLPQSVQKHNVPIRDIELSVFLSSEIGYLRVIEGRAILVN
jgi:hypothetical protein